MTVNTDTRSLVEIRMRPYITVSGVTTLADTALLSRRTVGARRVVGAVLVSAKTLRGEAVANPRYPTLATAQVLCARMAEGHVVPAVHYNSRAERDALCAELDALCAAVPAARMLQFNLPTLVRGALRHVRTRQPQVETVLQVNPGVMEAYAAPELDLDDLLRDVAGEVDHVLLDASQGRKVPLDAVSLAARIVAHRPDWEQHGLGMGFAGGLGPESGPLLGEIRQYVGPFCFSKLSWDAESALRTDDDTRLDSAKVDAYLALHADDGPRIAF